MRAILTFHSIDSSGSPISVSPGVFRTHAQWLASGRARAIPLDDLARRASDDEDAVAVTFDDGFLNTRAPIEALLAEGVPVTIFVVTGHAGGANNWGGRDTPGIPRLPLLGWRDLEQLTARGAQVAAHTRTHAALTTLSKDALEEELLGSQEDLRARFGSGSPHLAYPFGDVNARVAAAAAAAHYAWGHTTEFRLLKAHEEPLRLPRLDMYYFRAPGALEAWSSARFLRRLAWCRARRRIRAALPPAWFGRHRHARPAVNR